MLDLARLRVLWELKMRGTVGAVAQALGYSPSAVSQQLAQLQRDLGVELTERAGRRLRLTEAGEELARQAEVLLAAAQRAEEAALAAGGQVTGTVRVIGFQTALLNLVIPMLPGLADRYPDLVVEVMDDEFVRVLQSLALQEVDVVISGDHGRPTQSRPDGLSSEVLITEPVRLALPAGHPLASSAEPIEMPALAAESWASGHVGSIQAADEARACREYGGFEPQIRFRSNDLLVILAIVARGRAIALLPELIDAAGRPGVVVRDIAGVRLRRRMIVWTRHGAEVRPSVRAVLEGMRAAADTLVAANPVLVRGEREGTGARE